MERSTGREFSFPDSQSYVPVVVSANVTGLCGRLPHPNPDNGFAEPFSLISVEYPVAYSGVRQRNFDLTTIIKRK
jgi:hypothetical protein